MWNEGRYSAVTRPSQRLCEIVHPRVCGGRVPASQGTQVAKNVLHSMSGHLRGSATRANSTNGPVGDDERPNTIVSPHQSSNLSIATNEPPVHTIWVAWAIRPEGATTETARPGSSCHVAPSQYRGRWSS